MNLLKVKSENYSDYLQYINEINCGAVYPLSIAEGLQYGEIYESEDKSSVLLWHHCGFAFLAGACDETFLEAVYELILDQNHAGKRRLILFVNNTAAKDFFSVKANIVIEQRCFYEYRNAEAFYHTVLPDGYTIQEIDADILCRMQGRIVPSFSWSSDKVFLEKGKGFCILHGEHIAAWAFSAAVSSKEIDIGVETSPEYRNRGLAAVVSSRMIQYILEQNKKPVWACYAQNMASQALAEKIGFEKTGECLIVKKEDI